MLVKGFGYSDPGKDRSDNEDSFLVDNTLGLYIVCDGMGGEVAGKTASETAVTTIRDIIRELLPRISLIDNDHALCHGLSEIVRNAIQAASDKLLTMSAESQELRGMGSTATVLVTVGSKACVGHVGDTRLYLYRDESLHKLTKDHTVVQELIEKGALSSQKAASSPYAHVLTRALGRAELVPADTLVFDLLPGDRLICASDGLYQKAEEDTFRSVINELSVSEMAEALVQNAKEIDGSDNITSIVIGVEHKTPADEDDMARGEDVKLQIETLKQLYVFSDLTLQELLIVMDLVQIENCSEGKALIKEGEAGDSMYIILQGSFSVSKGDQVITTLSRGNHFGEMALLSKSPRTATVTAIAPSRLLKIARGDFTKLLVHESRIGVKLLWRLAGRLSYHLNQANIQLYGDEQA